MSIMVCEPSDLVQLTDGNDYEQYYKPDAARNF